MQLPHTDFRIKPDGTAIEPVAGGTHTMGFAFTESGDRFVVSTREPGIFVAPIEWRYLARNPDVAAPPLEQPATADQRVYPTSEPHPWRTRRATDPGFSKYYSDRYGIEESAPNGYFTSACSPLVYQDVALPGLRGQLLACEPAQNLVDRAVVERDGARLTLRLCRARSGPSSSRRAIPGSTPSPCRTRRTAASSSSTSTGRSSRTIRRSRVTCSSSTAWSMARTAAASGG